MIAVGVQWLELLENWMEVRKINHIAQTSKNKRFRCSHTKISHCKLNGSSRETLDCLIQDFAVCIRNVFFSAVM